MISGRLCRKGVKESKGGNRVVVLKLKKAPGLDGSVDRYRLSPKSKGGAMRIVS